MKYLEFDIKNMTLVRSTGDKTMLLSGAINYFGIHFNYDEEFETLTGVKSIEFYKNRKTVRKDVVDGNVSIPNEMIADKTPFEMRVIAGNVVATPWVSVGITESGSIKLEAPEEELPDTLDYVKTPIGDGAIAEIRAGANGLEYSVDGVNYEQGVNGVPDVPTTPADIAYVRKKGDWVPANLPEADTLMIGTASTIATIADPTTATPEDTANKLNELITALQVRGVIS